MTGSSIIGNRWLAIAVGTLVWALAFWFGLLAVPSDRTVGFAIMAVGLVFALYAVTFVAGGDTPTATAFRGSLLALACGCAVVLIAAVGDDERVAAAAAVLAPGVGGAICLPPARDVLRTGVRLAVTVGLTIVGVALYSTDATVFGLLAPLYVLPLLAVSDIYVDRVREGARAAAPPDDDGPH